MITAVTLQGFKSFAQTTRLEFGPGITAVIGPNGSGKSNVVEALRWVTQGARARELRAGRATELIFHGSQGRSPVGLAEVTLELRDLPASPRLSVARRVYRDGTGEQDLSGRAARVRDVHAALRGSGLGPGGLAVIGQGEVSGVVGAEPSTLLGYLEEAADLSRLASARDETRVRLREADETLARLRLLEDELTVRVQRLAGDARDARRARDLALRELALRASLARARQEDLAREVTALREREAALAGASAEVAASVAGAHEAQEAIREALGRAGERRRAYAAALALVEAARDRVTQARTYLQHVQGEARRAQGERGALTLTAPETPAPDLAALGAAVAGARVSAATLDAELRGAETEVAALRAAHARAREGLARHDAARQTFSAELARAEEALALALSATTEADAALEVARTAREALDARVREATLTRDAARGRLRDVRAQEASVAASRAPLGRERQRLQDLLASFSRYGEGSRNALRSGVSGIVGAVADLLVVPETYETAVTAALGRRLEQVVVRDADVAREIIEHLKRVGGRATFLPLDLLRPRPRRDHALKREAGVIGNLADLCPSDPAILADVLLSDTLVVEDTRAASRLARTHASRPRLVTLGGELLEPGGALTGGRLRDTGSSHLADQRRLAELDEELAGADTALAQLTVRRGALEREAERLGGEVDALTTERDAAARTEREAERRASEAGATRRAAQAARDRLTARLSEPEQAAGAGEAEPELPDLDSREAARSALAASATAARDELLRAQEALSAGRETQAAWEAFTRAEERARALDVRLGELSAAQDTQSRLVEEAEAALSARLGELGDFDDSELPLLERQRSEAAQTYGNLIGRQNRLRAELDEVRLTAARREASLEPIEPGALLAGSPREWQAELGLVTRDLAALGAVNARAEEEYAVERARLDELTAQRSDASDAASELRRSLDDLERDGQARLSLALTRVQDAFTLYARELLGGEGELAALSDDRGYLVGLRLGVQPKGKRTRAMNLLSAGERTMAGLAFLFALGHAAQSRGLPLAVLDEVDAPLDEANIRRFTRFLEVFAARGAQFILVTHQKATMEVASALWGVTTDASGASRVLSIRQASDVLREM